MSRQYEADSVLHEVHDERVRQEQKWGQQNHPWVNTPVHGVKWYRVNNQAWAKEIVDTLARQDMLDYVGIITEEYYEALEAPTIEEARVELVQLAACCVAAIESIDRNGR
jgi:hypothetical protein